MLCYRLWVSDKTPAQDGFKVSNVFLCLFSPPVTVYEGFNSISLHTSFNAQFQGSRTERKAVHHSRMFYDACRRKQDDTRLGAFVTGKDKETGQKRISQI